MSDAVLIVSPTVMFGFHIRVIVMHVFLCISTVIVAVLPCRLLI